MQSNFFRVITENRIEEAREMALLVEQGNDPVHANTNRSVREVLTGKLEKKAATQLAKSHLEGATKKSGKNTKKKRCGASETPG